MALFAFFMDVTIPVCIYIMNRYFGMTWNSDPSFWIYENTLINILFIYPWYRWQSKLIDSSKDLW